MSQLSSDQQEQDVAPPRAAPLTCFKRSGEPYTRHDGVEAQIAEALSMPPSAWCDRNWRIETLVYLIRLTRGDEEPNLFGMLSHQFFVRVAPLVANWSRGYSVADSEVIQSAAADELGRLLNESPPSRTAEYLEIDAATVIKQVTLRVTGPDRPKAGAFQSADRDEDGGYTPTVERLASEDLDPVELLIAKAEDEAGGAMRYLDAVTDPRHREAFILRHLYDWPVKDGPPGTPTLCDHFKMSARQIQNWIKTATEQMRAAHGAES